MKSKETVINDALDALNNDEFVKFCRSWIHKNKDKLHVDFSYHFIKSIMEILND